MDAEQVDLLEYIGWHEEVCDIGPAPIAEMSDFLSTAADEASMDQLACYDESAFNQMSSMFGENIKQLLELGPEGLCGMLHICLFIFTLTVLLCLYSLLVKSSIYNTTVV